MVFQKKRWFYTTNPHFFRLEKSGWPEKKIRAWRTTFLEKWLQNKWSIGSFMNQNAWKKFENSYSNLCFAHLSGMHQHSLLHVDWKNCGVNFQNSRNLKHESYCKTVWLSDSFSKVSVALLWILQAKRESFRMLFLAKWYFFTKIVMTYSEKKLF